MPFARPPGWDKNKTDLPVATKINQNPLACPREEPSRVVATNDTVIQGPGVINRGRFYNGCDI